MITAAKNADRHMLEIELPESYEDKIKTILQAQQITGRITRIFDNNRGRLFVILSPEEPIYIVEYLIYLKGLNTVG